jgi:hypothetical protein
MKSDIGCLHGALCRITSTPLFGCFPGEELAAVIHSWKSFSAKHANQVLGLRGAFWQREYYDHLIRGDEEFERAVRYVAENPLKANLKDWKWVWVCGRDARTTAAEDGGATKLRDDGFFYGS